eukprot:240338-Prymnesium_polylepis.1
MPGRGSDARGRTGSDPRASCRRGARERGPPTPARRARAAPHRASGSHRSHRAPRATASPRRLGGRVGRVGR